MRILLVSGGTGGHVYPVAAVARIFRSQSQQSGQELQMEIVGDGKLLAQIASELNLRLNALPRIGMRRYFSVLNLLDLFKIPVIFFQSLFFLWRFMPDTVFIKGSGASLIVGFVARVLFISVIIHESDAIPSMTNIKLGKFAKKILISFENSVKYFDPTRTVLTGHPIRSEILNSTKEAGLQAFGLKPGLPTVFITGGSQGARRINQIVMESLVGLATEFQIIHQVGESDFKDIDKQLKDLIEDGKDSYGPKVKDNYRFYSFLNTQEIANAYAASDVVVSRSGAGSIFEIAAWGRPTVLIPLVNSASDHQQANADEFAKYGAIVIREENLTTHIFINEIKVAYEKRWELGEKIKTFAKLDAANAIVQQLF